MSWVFFFYQEVKNQLHRKVGFEGTPKLNPCWKSQPVTCKVNTEWKLELNLWRKTILIRGSEFLMDIEQVGHRLDRQRVRRQRAGDFYNEDGSICVCKAGQRLNQNREDFPLLAHLQGLYLFLKEHGLRLNQELKSIKRTQWQKRLNTLLRHGELLDDLRNKFKYSQYWSDDVWKSKMAGGGDNMKIFQYCTDPSGQEILYLRAFQGHSGRNPVDPSLQDSVVIPSNFFEYIYHIGCAVSLHSITKSGLIAGGPKSSRERQTVFFKAVNPMNKNHKDPQELDLTKPRLASYKQKWKRHQGAVYWVDIQLAQRKGLKFYQTRSNAIILYDTLPAYCISKVVVMKSEEIKYQKVRVSPRPPQKVSCRDNWMCDLDSDVAGISKDTQRIQPKPKTQLSRTGDP